jgi:DNA repair protein RadA/Sms
MMTTKSLVNGAARNEQPAEDALLPPTPRKDGFGLEAALERIHQVSPKKQAVRIFRKHFNGAVTERMKSGDFTCHIDAQKWLIAIILLYYEKKNRWPSDREYAQTPGAFFENRTYMEDSVAWDGPTGRLTSERKAADQRDKERVWELSESLPRTAEATRTDKARHPNLIRLSEVEPRCVDYLWEPFIPRGMLTMLSGDPSVGKSFIALSVAAELSRGRLLDGRRGEPLTTLYLSNENPTAEVIRPRFDALGGDPNYLFVLSGKNIPTEYGEETIAITLDDVGAIDAAIRDSGARLVIVDPIQSFMGSSVDLHRSNETRPVLDRLAKLADAHGCAVLLIRHISKQTGGKAIHRGLGSIDLTGAVRSELLAGSPPDDPNARALIHIKSNIGRLGDAQGYAIDEEGNFTWTGKSTITAAEILAAPDAPGERKIAEATRWLGEILQPGSCKPKEIIRLAKEAGISWATIRRAQKKLGSKPHKEGRSWVWSFPQDAHGDEHTHKMSTFTKNEHLKREKKRINTSSIEGDAQDAQKNCVSTLVNIFEKDPSAAEEKSRKICLPDFKNVDNRMIEPIGKIRSLVGFNRNRRRVQ